MSAKGCGGGLARSYARGEEMPWNRGARVSKEDHRAATEHVLRPREAQRTRAGAGDAGGSRPARAGEMAAQTQGRHVARGKAAWGGGCTAHGQQERRRVGQRKQRAEGWR
jgi:hypothetical protein